MPSLRLSPVDNNVLSSNLVFRQLTQNSYDLTLTSGNATAVNTPKIMLDGCGRAYLTGSLRVANASPSVGMPLFTLPEFLSVPHQYNLHAVKNSSGTISDSIIGLAELSSGIASVTITNQGNYTTNIVPVLSGNGSGAILVSHMKVRTITSTVPGTGYVPNDTIALAGGTFSTRGTATVTSTQVVSATVTAGGSGGTNGTQTVTGTTGTGTKFTASVTVSGGAITAVLSITLGGTYTVNPTSLTAEPVTGAGLTGATLHIVMGVFLAAPNVIGDYTDVPLGTVSQFSTTGSGTGYGAVITWGLLSVVVVAPGEGYDSSSLITFTGTAGITATATLVLGSASSSSITQVTGYLEQSTAQNDVISLDGIVFFVNSYN